MHRVLVTLLVAAISAEMSAESGVRSAATSPKSAAEHYDAKAQSTPPPIVKINVGDALVQGATLKPYTVHWTETIVNVQNIAVERAHWTDVLTAVERAGRPAWNRHIDVVTPQGTFREMVDITVDAATLTPISSEEKNPSGSYRFTFDRGVLTGERTGPDGSTTKIQGSSARPAFDFYGGMMDLFLATLPLRSAFRATFPAWMATTGPGANASSIDWPIVQCQGEEDVASGGKTYRAWRAEINTAYGFYRVWVRRSPPFVVKTILLIPPGGRITYELSDRLP